MKTPHVLFWLFVSLLWVSAQELHPYTPIPRRMMGEQEAELRLEAPVIALSLDSPDVELISVQADNDSGRAQGVLPKGWRDNSVWAKVWTEYSILKYDGIPYLRIEVSRQLSGNGQIQAEFDESMLVPGRSYQLSIRARSSSRTPIKLGIRHRGAPYRYQHAFTAQLEPGFKPYTFNFQAVEATQPMGFYLVIPDTGVVEIESIQLSEVDQASLEAWVTERFPEGLPDNLIRNSQLPLGLQSGWALDRNSSDGDEVRVEPDPSAPGVNGVPSLRLESVKADQQFQVYTVPVELPLPNRPYRIAVRVKGTGSLGLEAFRREKRVGKTTWDLSGDDWQIQEFVFTPREQGEHVFALVGTGTFHLDTVQVHEGREAKPFARQGQAELSLAVPRPARFVFEDEEAVLTYGVVGAPSDSLLKLKVVTPYQEELRLPSVALEEKTFQTGDIPWHQFKNRPFGVFRIEGVITDAEGTPISPVQELVVHRLRRPRYWGKDAPDSPFGVHTEAAKRHVEMTKAMGINWVRLHDAGLGYIGWFWLEPKPGEWVFFDEELKRYREEELLIFGELGTAPTWASYWTGSGRTQVGYFDRFFQPRDLGQYRNYVQTVVSRYKDIIRAYDVWNEPWIAEWWGVDWDPEIGGREGWKTSEEPQQDFARMMKTAYETVKAIDPGIQVAGFNTTSGGGSFNRIKGTDWTQGVLEAGGMAHSDMIAFHTYEGGRAAGPDCAIASAVDRALSPVRNEDGSWPRPIWMTEGSHRPGSAGTHFYYHSVKTPSSEGPFRESDRLVRYQVACLANGVSRIFLYSMHSHRHLGLSGRFNVLVTPEGYLNASSAAQSAMAWHLEDKPFRGQMDLPQGLRVHLFQGETEQVAVLCPHPEYQAGSWRLPAIQGVRYEDLFGNPLAPGDALGAHTVYAIGQVDMQTFSGASPEE